jgi:dipeptidyl-peptidase 4
MRLKMWAIMAFCLTFAPLWAQTTITLEDVFLKGTFKTKRVLGFNFTPDGNHYLTQKGDSILMEACNRSKVPELLFSLADVKGQISSYDDFKINDDLRYLTLISESKPLYRRSVLGMYLVYDRTAKKLTKVPLNSLQRDADLSPDGKRVAFVSNNNLYTMETATAKLQQVTSDGKDGSIINGVADWVYEEEFGQSRYYEWSPDSRYIAFVRFDESQVPLFNLEYQDDQAYPRIYSYKYPKVGANNAVVTVHIYDTVKKKTKQVALDPKTYYVPRLKWTPKGQLCVFEMNRLQNYLDLNIYDAKGARQSTLLRETSLTYIDIHDNLTFLDDNKGFLWTSEKDGYNHIYHYSAKGDAYIQLTKGDWEVTEFYGYDAKRNLCHFQAAKINAVGREWYSVSLEGGEPKNMIGGGGWNDFQFSPTFDYYMLTHASVDHPPYFELNTYDGTQPRDLERNEPLRALQKKHNVQPVTFFEVPASAANPEKLNGWMIKPPSFDETKKYPVFMYLYGGPGSQETADNFHRYYWWFQLLAQEGYIVACVDNRGTGARGEAFKKCTYKQLGKLETEDQIAAARYLGTQKYVDASRIGIFGWSYGGYMSSLCLLKGNDVFKVGLAVAPVTNWKWYDSVYTERFMQTETENAAGYAENSPVYYADRLKGKYFLAHGTGDDNVHFQNSLEMSNALIKANKEFEFYAYPNRNHGISGGNTRLHLFTRMTNFIKTNL